MSDTPLDSDTLAFLSAHGAAQADRRADRETLIPTQTASWAAGVLSESFGAMYDALDAHAQAAAQNAVCAGYAARHEALHASPELRATVAAATVASRNRQFRADDEERIAELMRKRDAAHEAGLAAAVAERNGDRDPRGPLLKALTMAVLAYTLANDNVIRGLCNFEDRWGCAYVAPHA